MYPGLLRTRISWHHFAQMILLFPKLFKTFSLSSKNAQRKLREIGPAVKVGSLNKSDKFYYLKQINFKESKTLPSDSVVIEAVGRPSAFEQMATRLNLVEKLLAKLTASSLLIHIVQNVKYFENGLVNFWFPEIRDKHMNFRKLALAVGKKPDLSKRYEDFIILKPFQVINAILCSPYFKDLKDGRDEAAHPSFKFDNFSTEMELFKKLKLTDLTGEFRDVATIKNIMPLYTDFLIAFAENPKEFKVVELVSDGPEHEPDA